MFKPASSAASVKPSPSAALPISLVISLKESLVSLPSSANLKSLLFISLFLRNAFCIPLRPNFSRA
jgi:hypothetical protein